MKFILKNINYFNNREINKNIITYLNISQKYFDYYIDVGNNTINYIVFNEKIKLIQIIFQEERITKESNFNILEQGIKYIKNYKIEQILQYNILLYNNIENYEIKTWMFKDYKNEFNHNYYKIYIYNLKNFKKSKDNNLRLLYNIIYKL